MDLPPIMRITLKGADNETYVGTLFLKNWTSWLGDTFPGWAREDPTKRHAAITDSSHTRRPPDPTGATYYVIAVVLVYGMSIVMLIASHIKRKHAKVLEDRQINKYLQEFQIVRETSSRDSYRNLKRDITAKLKDGKSANGYRGLTKLSLLPLAALALPTIRENRLSISKEGKRKYSLSPRCSFSRSSISSTKASSERKYSVLSVQSDRTGRQVGNLLAVSASDRAMRSSGSVDEAFSSAASAKNNGPSSSRDSDGGKTASARRLSSPCIQHQQQQLLPPSVGRQQQPSKRAPAKRLQRSHHILVEPTPETRKPRSTNCDSVLQATATRSRLSPKELATSRSPAAVESSSGGSSFSFDRSQEPRKLSASHQSADVLLAAVNARRGITANLSADNLSRVFPSGDVTTPAVGTFVTAASLPVPTVKNSSSSHNNHLLPPADAVNRLS